MGRKGQGAKVERPKCHQEEPRAPAAAVLGLSRAWTSPGAVGVTVGSEQGLVFLPVFSRTSGCCVEGGAGEGGHEIQGDPGDCWASGRGAGKGGGLSGGRDRQEAGCGD